ncbi:hypothetical protein [Nocardia asiatica]|uniref:hypothetical protein n=1 Tax=Nocardia asiatica TaxID=209252 RepID=UPI002455CF9B|nr:hypothetical protein [Nocardia asiatica]
MSKPPDYHWFEVHGDIIEVALEGVDFGIVIHDPVGPVTYWIDSDGELCKRVGRVVIRDDTVTEVWPHEGVNSVDLNVLRGAIVEAWSNAPCEQAGWSRHEGGEGGGYWDCRLSVEVNMILAAEGSNHECAPRAADLEPAA